MYNSDGSQLNLLQRLHNLDNMSFMAEETLKEFSETEYFSLIRDTRLIDYQNAQIILICAMEGRDAIKNEIGVEIEEIDQSHDTLQADIFNKLKARNDQVLIRPLTEGKIE